MFEAWSLWITLGFLVAATLYASVGHAGASGYLAVMALAGMAPAEMKPIALVLNILVSTIGTVLYVRAGCFSWPLLWPFLIGSVPLAFVGGALPLPPYGFKLLVAALLVLAAVRLVVTPAPSTASPTDAPRLGSVGIGAVIGLLSGLTGTGGGIFLTPVLLFAGWADSRRAAGVSSAFIFANSIAGLLGNSRGLPDLPPAFPLWAVAVMGGGTLGAWFGSRRLAPLVLRRLLSLVLMVVAAKLIFG